MGNQHSNTRVLDGYDSPELVLELLSFAGGENKISEDQAMKSNEARVCENWEATSLGGMERAKGFNEVADGGASYTGALDFLCQHKDSGGTQIYGIVEGDLIYKNAAAFTNDDNGAFTSGVLSHGFSDEGGGLWVTNATDNLKKKSVGVAIITPTDVPPTACARLYSHKNRMVAEGSATYPYRVYGSRTGKGNWSSYSMSAVVFTGAGLNDATSGGTYSGSGGTNTYTVIIDGTGTPDTFKWKKNSGSFTTTVAITGAAQTLTDGVTITFSATTGHTLNDQWVITVTADAWTLANDAWSIDLPETTQGCVANFPSGNEVLVFTKRNAYALSGFPNTSFRAVSSPGRGCSAPYSIALGDEGVYFVSEFPTKSIFLYDGVNFTELTQFNKDVSVELIDFSKRIYGVYRNRKYYLMYNELNSGVSYPNRLRIYDAKFGRWMNRPTASALSDFFGYPALLKYSNNELYAASSKQDKIYELETEDNSDEGHATAAVYTTKDFSSRDFAVASGGQFPIDDVKLKLLKMTVTYYGTTGALGVQWSADRGLHSGSKTITLTANGDVINSNFTVNTSYVVTTPPDKSITVPFSNDAVGSRFNFQFTNSGTSTRPKIKRVKIHAITADEA